MNFFSRANEQSDSESNQSSQEQDERKPNMMMDILDSSSEEDEKRKVLSEKDKRYNNMKETISNIKQKLERHEFSQVEEEFKKLNKEYEKAKKIIEEGGIPSFYIRVLYRLDDKLRNFSKEEKDKLSQANSKAFNAIKRNITKMSKEIIESLSKFKENPTQTTEDESGNEETDSDFKSDSSDDSIHPLESDDPMVRRKFWLLKPDKKAEQEKSESLSSDEEKKDEGRKKPKVNKDNLEIKISEVSKEKEIIINTSHEGTTATLKEFVKNRTQKQFDLKFAYQSLNEYLKHYDKQDNTQFIIEIILILIPIRIDYSKQISITYMNKELWQETFDNVELLLKKLKVPENRSKQYLTYQLQEDSKYHNQKNVLQSIQTFFNTIVVELNKSFYNIDHSQEEYFQRIGDIYNILRLGKQIQEFYEELNQKDICAKMAFLRLENMYYIHENTLQALRDHYKQRNLSTKDHIFDENVSLENIINDLSQLINKTPDQDIARATLYQVYHHSIHNRINTARDLLLMSRITDTIQNMDSTIQTLYNRVLVQLGLGYFRQGNLIESFTFLNDLCSQGKTKELIGQNPLRYLSNNDRKKIFPPHQHLKVDTVETFYLIVSMLLDFPNMISDTYNKNIYSRMFRKLCEQYNRSHLVAIPESSKDFIYAASKELQKGNWKECFKLLLEAPVWNGALYSEQTQTILLQRVKEQSYKCYLFTFKNSFESISLAELSQKFDLRESEINAITFKMISAQELNAHIHTVNNQLHIVFEHQDRTSLQSISSKLIDQLQNTQHQNQKILDKKVGNQQQTLSGKQEEEQTDYINKQGLTFKTKKKATFQAAPPGKRGPKKNTKRNY